MTTSNPMAAHEDVDDSADRGTGRFLSGAAPFWQLLVRGAVLLMATLGVYRFWLVTDIRRFLWGNTEIAGDLLEYLGTARELLLGFLMAIALLLPIYAAFFFAALGLGMFGRAGGVIGFAMLVLLGQFAVYRARRYRLTRTLFRGLRLHQTGSAWRYAICSVSWWIVIVLTLGLAYPWGRCSLERYKMRNTFYGDLRGRFDGSATRLFLRGLPLWLFVVAPTLVGLAIISRTVEWTALGDAISHGGDDVMSRIEGASPGFAAAIVYAALAVGWAAAAAATLYPAFQAMVLRWWLSGLRFGDIAATSRLRTGSVYAVYVRFIWYALLLSLVILVVTLLIAFLIRLVAHVSGRQDLSEALGTALSVGVYAVTALAYSTIYQATVKLRLWRLGFESVQLSGLGALDRVRAVGQASSAFGEGLVDALQVGGY